MNAKDAIRHTLKVNHDVLKGYLSDLSDADLLVRPVPGANHIAWQLGHRITAEAKYFLPLIPGAKAAELPAGFADQHGKTKAAAEPPTGFLTKAEYLGVFERVRQATFGALEQVPDADLDKPITGDIA